MVFKDYYKILDLQSANVSSDEIKQAYRLQAKKYHPDRNKDFSEDRIQDINEAYKILSDMNLKRKYDRKWKVYIERNRIGNKTYEARKQEKTLKEEVFSVFFGEFRRKSKKEKNESLPRLKGDNIKTEISIKLKDGFLGSKKYLSLRDVNGTLQRIPIEIPVGIKNHDKIRIVGFGKPGINDGKNGDLFVEIKLEDDAKFILEGNDIRTVVDIYPWEAALGTSVDVEGIDDNMTLKISAGTQSGKRYSVKNKGYHDGFGGRGNFLIDINIKMPDKMTDEELELYRKLEELKSE